LKKLLFVGIVFVVGFGCVRVLGADNDSIQRMALCQDSWLEWNKSAPALLKTFADQFRSEFSSSSDDSYFIPKTSVTIAGLPVVQAFPQSVGMGVGFSLAVASDFQTARKRVEAMLGKAVNKCEASDGMHSCELDIAEQRTVMLMAEDDVDNKTLIGCYYYYEK